MQTGVLNLNWYHMQFWIDSDKRNYSSEVSQNISPTAISLCFVSKIHLHNTECVMHRKISCSKYFSLGKTEVVHYIYNKLEEEVKGLTS